MGWYRDPEMGAIRILYGVSKVRRLREELEKLCVPDGLDLEGGC